MTNREIARILDHIADILQFKDDNPFKVKAYRQAANSIYHLDEDIHYLYEKGRLDEIPGVGKAIKAKIEEMVDKGSCEYYEMTAAGSSCRAVGYALYTRGRFQDRKSLV